MLDPSLQHLVIQLHLYSTLFMTGVIWYVQVVHYPLLRFIQSEDGKDFADLYKKKSGLIVVPFMLTELVTGILLIGSTWMMQYGYYLWMNLILLLGIWVVTFTVHLPQHKALTNSFNSETIRPLVRSDWIRTLIWSIRSVLLVSFLS
ncbi:MAG: hypothetical protein O7C75_00315 [Verrucomicrobia bacterium]|nr:hypothetical protein [Verrucomicrobiota bacterium]